MQLPLEALAAVGEHTHLARDQFVEVGTLQPAEVAIEDKASASQTEIAQERPVALHRHTPRQRVGDMVANLRVIGGQQLGDVGHRQTLTLSLLSSPQLAGAGFSVRGATLWLSSM